MPKLFKLVKEEYSKVDKEKQWTYSIQFPFTFNEQKITKITITDYTWTKKGRAGITCELILNIFKAMANVKEMEPNLRKILIENASILLLKEFRLMVRNIS